MSLDDPKKTLPVRDPRSELSAGYLTIFDLDGNPHRKPAIVAKECLRTMAFTRDPLVAQARRDAAAKATEAKAKAPKKSASPKPGAKASATASSPEKS